MSAFIPRDVVWTEFPFTDLSDTKWRPALIVRRVSGTDYIVCQLTSKRYKDHFIPLDTGDYEWGYGQAISHVNPKKIFTLNIELMEQRPEGRLTRECFNRVCQAIIDELLAE